MCGTILTICHSIYIKKKKREQLTIGFITVEVELTRLRCGVRCTRCVSEERFFRYSPKSVAGTIKISNIRVGTVCRMHYILDFPSSVQFERKDEVEVELLTVL
jgi:hypothetical protein